MAASGRRRGREGAGGAAAAVGAACALVATAAAGQDRVEAPPQGGASPGSQSDTPTDKPQLRAFCTDRPGQGTLPCTVDAGRWQVESDLVNGTYDRGEGRETLLFTDPVVKLGVAPRADVELQLAPYEEVRTFAAPGAPPRDLAGVGDLVVRYKQNVFGDYRGPFALALAPFVKAPTARRGLGDGAWEGGVLAPFAVGLSKSLVLNLAPEVDVRRDVRSPALHAEEFGVVNVTLSLPLHLGLLVEAAARHSGDPNDAHTQVFSDFALSLSLPNDAELDVGVNHGLNRRTPSDQVYAGVAKRF